MLVIFLLMSGALLPGGEISRLSLSSEGDEDDRTCRAPQVSADGSVVAF
jgi:hypothetical protein